MVISKLWARLRTIQGVNAKLLRKRLFAWDVHGAGCCEEFFSDRFYDHRNHKADVLSMIETYWGIFGGIVCSAGQLDEQQQGIRRVCSVKTRKILGAQGPSH